MQTIANLANAEAAAQLVRTRLQQRPRMMILTYLMKHVVKQQQKM